MIGSLLKFLFFKPWGVTLLGILIMGLGAVMTSDGHTDLPERASLQQVAGVLDRATKVTRRRSVKYELEIKGASGEAVTLTLPEREISEDQVRRLLGEPVEALFSGTKDVWELSSGTTKIIEYEKTREQRKETKAIEAEFGPYVGGGGVLVSLLGVLWVVRRRRGAGQAA